MTKRGPPLFTIGYERDTLEGVIGRLRNAGVDYVHLRPLDMPKAGREVARGGDRQQETRIHVLAIAGSPE